MQPQNPLPAFAPCLAVRRTIALPRFRQAGVAGDAQHKRSLVPLEPEQWEHCLTGIEDKARTMLVAPQAERFDLADVRRTDALL